MLQGVLVTYPMLQPEFRKSNTMTWHCPDDPERHGTTVAPETWECRFQDRTGLRERMEEWCVDNGIDHRVCSGQHVHFQWNVKTIIFIFPSEQDATMFFMRFR